MRFQGRRKRTRGIERLEPRQLLASVPVVIDLLAVYTPQARTDIGGDAAITAKIQGSVDLMNQALINSQISVTIRLVHAEVVTYSGSNDLLLDRQRLETPSDGHIDSIFALRNQYGADLVTLITDGNVAGGNADLMTSTTDPNNPNLAFSAIADASIGPGFLTLAHELGHNLGGGHERNNPTQPAVGPFPYSYGYRYQAPNGTWYYDIMSYSYPPDQPLPLYANPSVSFAGAPVGKPSGDPNSADLASTFTQTAPIVAAYRSTVVTDNAGPKAAVSEINRTGAVCDFTIRYADDSGVDLSTLDSADVIVSGPGGWSIPATFVSMSQPTVAGAYKYATYHVVLPATNPTTSSLTFSLNASAVKDINGNFASAGAIATYNASVAGFYAWAQDLGTLSHDSTRTEFGHLDGIDNLYFYKFTVAATTTVGLSMTGLSADANVQFTQDLNNDGVFQNGEELSWSDNTGTQDEGVARTFAAGTYYAMVYHNYPAPVTPFTISFHAYTDSAPPTATLDATDQRAANAGTSSHSFSVTYSDDNEVDGNSVYWDGGIQLDITNPNYSWVWWVYPDHTLTTSHANGKTRTMYYKLIPFDNAPTFDSSYDGTYSVSVINNALRPKDGAGNFIVAGTIGSFQWAPGASDTAAPTATLLASSPAAGQTTWDFNVVYKDNTSINLATLDGGDIRVTGPGGFNQLASFVSCTTAPTVGSAITAIYRVTAPGGFWDSTDDGTYTVTLQSGQVKDPSNNSAASNTTLGTVVSSMPNLTSAGGGTVTFTGTASPDTMRFRGDATYIYYTLNDAASWYIPRSVFTRASMSALAGTDAINFDGGTLTGGIAAGSDADSLTVNAGTLTLDADSGASGASVAATINSGAFLVLAASQRFSNLTVNGTLDLKTFRVVVDYPTASPVGTWTGTNYLGLTGSIRAGKIITTSGTVQLNGVGISEASTALNISNTQTAVWGTYTVDATTALLRYTYRGDANLDGKITGDDYFRIDQGFAAHTTGYAAGDFDYSGKINADDYFLIDSNYGHAQSVLAGSLPAGAEMAEIPASLALFSADQTINQRKRTTGLDDAEMEDLAIL